MALVGEGFEPRRGRCVVDPVGSSDMRRYACFSQRLFQAMSSLTSSCHRRETCDDLANVFASSINVRI